MKKVILILAAGTFLTSCGGSWSCKKRYCQTQQKNILKVETPTHIKNEVIVKP